MLVGEEGNLYVERDHAVYPYLIDFLVSCCEPVSRTHHMEQYVISPSSLSAATAEGTYSCAMIRSFLTYWQFDTTQGHRELPLDMQKVAALYCLAGEERREILPRESARVVTRTPGAGAQLSPSPGGHPSAQEGGEEWWWDCWMEGKSADESTAAVSSGGSGSGRSWKAFKTALEKAWPHRAPRRPSLQGRDNKSELPHSPVSSHPPDGGASATPVTSTTASLPPKRLNLSFLKPTSTSTATSLTSQSATTATTRKPVTPPPVHSSTPSPASSLRTAVRAPLPFPVPLPGIHYALREEWRDGNSRALPSIPLAVQEMLREEEQASKVEVVLEPRLRRFHTYRTSAGGMSAPLNERKQASGSDALTHFLVTKDRLLLESVVESVKEWLEPVRLAGVEQYIVSDLSREVLALAKQRKQEHQQQQQQQMGEHENAPSRRNTLEFVGEDAGAHRSRLLDRLYVPSSAVLNANAPFDGTKTEPLSLPGTRMGTPTSPHSRTHVGAIPSSHGLEYKSAIQRGCLRQVREALFKRFGIRTDCCYDYVNDITTDGRPPHRTSPSFNSASAMRHATSNSKDGSSNPQTSTAVVVPFHVDRLELSREVKLRPYQVTSLDRFRRGQVAHQGVVVLPCGAGKTLTGIAAAATLKKRTIVMCVNHMSVFQWQREFLRWTNLKPSEVTVCTSKVKQMPGPVFITTYSMLVAKRPNRGGAEGTAKGVEAQRSEEILDAIQRETWGLLLLDEVHTALGHHFQEVLNKVQYKCVLGLSATLLREDDRISDLRHLVGPKLYEANWLDLTRAGFLAKVECAEIQCPLPLPYWRKYVEVTGSEPNLCAVLRSLEDDAATGSAAGPRGGCATTPSRRGRPAAPPRQRRRRRFSASESEEDSFSDSGSNSSAEDSSGESEAGDAESPARRRPRGGGAKRPRGRHEEQRGNGEASHSSLRHAKRGNQTMGPAQTLASCNPVKLWCAQALLHFHLKERSPPDKVIIFCDYLIDAHFYALHLHVPLMEQATSELERRNLLRWFQFSTEVNALILTRVGDVALDIPNASVIIQISGLGASRRQEAQRLGRILRPKPPSLDHSCSYFYSLVSQDTHEIRTSSLRQSWLRDQGFSYRVLTADTVLEWYCQEGGAYPSPLGRGNTGGATKPSALPSRLSGTSSSLKGSLSQRPLCCVGPPQWWYMLRPQEYHWIQQQHQAQQRAVKKEEASVNVSLVMPPQPQRATLPDAVLHGLRAYQGGYWAPFTPADSVRLQYGFHRGTPVVPIKDGLPHLLQMSQQQRQVPSGTGGAVSSVSWRTLPLEVHFSSVDAPNTFGTVQLHNSITHEPNSSSEESDADDDERSPLARSHPGAPRPISDGSSAALKNSTLSEVPAAFRLPRRVLFGPMNDGHYCLAKENERCVNFALESIEPRK